jgi:hypothetical protein
MTSSGKRQLTNDDDKPKDNVHHASSETKQQLTDKPATVTAGGNNGNKNKEAIAANELTGGRGIEPQLTNENKVRTDNRAKATAAIIDRQRATETAFVG